MRLETLTLGGGAAFVVIVLASQGCTLLSGADRLDVVSSCEDTSSCKRDDVTTSTLPAQTRGSGEGGDGGAPQAPSQPTADASPDSAPSSTTTPLPNHELTCDGLTCTGITPLCCQFQAQRGQCVATANECLSQSPGTAVIACDRAGDCGVGQVCCANALTRTAQCTTASACVGNNTRLLCVSDGDCPGGTVCFGQSPLFQHLYCDGP